jgi:hypothetical protein
VKEEADLWEQQFGSLNYKGAWSARTYHPANVAPEMPEGAPKTKALNDNAVDFIIHPGGSSCGGLSIGKHRTCYPQGPQVVSLSKELVLMGSGYDTPLAGRSINERQARVQRVVRS